MWEQFAVVAADLLERIQSSMSYNNTPCDTSDDDDNEQNVIGNPAISNQQIKKWLQEPWWMMDEYGIAGIPEINSDLN